MDSCQFNNSVSDLLVSYSAFLSRCTVNSLFRINETVEVTESLKVSVGVYNDSNAMNEVTEKQFHLAWNFSHPVINTTVEPGQPTSFQSTRHPPCKFQSLCLLLFSEIHHADAVLFRNIYSGNGVTFYFVLTIVHSSILPTGMVAR